MLLSCYRADLLSTYLTSSVAAATPRTELPLSSSLGDQNEMPHTLGMTTYTHPATPNKCAHTQSAQRSAHGQHTVSTQPACGQHRGQLNGQQGQHSVSTQSAHGHAQQELASHVQ